MANLAAARDRQTVTTLGGPSADAPPPKPIGGFFGLEKPVVSAVPPAAGLDGPHSLLFWNARSALTHLLAILGPGRVWLPAYVCVEVAHAAADAGCEVAFYPVGQQLIPDETVLVDGLRAGDAVLGVDYFGVPSPVLPALTRRFSDVTFIQDRAQALWPDPSPWGRYLLYSPRKVLGAPDGGVLISPRGPIPPPDWSVDQDQSRLEPATQRALDPDGVRNDVWFAAYRAAEAAMTSEPKPISPLSRSVIEATDTAVLLQRRRSNAEILLSSVGEAAFFAAERLLTGAPLGVPVLTADAALVAGRMASTRVYCARHWAMLPSPQSAFPVEHDLSRRLLTLPCDHRYDGEDMRRVAEAFLACR